MEIDQLLRHAVTTLDRLGIAYLVTGSVATMFYGEPRFTNDIDIVAELTAEKVPAFRAAFPPVDFYLDEERMHQAIARRGQFNVIHPASGLKIDVMIADDSPFDHSRMARARRERPAPDFSARFASPEDAILKKMEYFRAGGSDKHLRDVLGVLEISGADIDRQYVQQWVERLGLQEVWAAILGRLETSE